MQRFLCKWLSLITALLLTFPFHANGVEIPTSVITYLLNDSKSAGPPDGSTQLGTSFVGGEFRVNTYSTNNQNYPKVAAGTNGKVVVVWESDGRDGDGHGVAAQRYNADGSKWGEEFLANTETELAQSQPTVAVAADGSHIILWRSKGQDGSEFGVYAQRYDQNGNEVGDEFRVNEETDDNQDLAYAAYHSNGNVMIVWQSSGQDGNAGEIYARVYDDEFNDVSNGEFRVNAVIKNWQNTARITAVPSGFIVVWESLESFAIDSVRLSIVFRRFDTDGNALMDKEQQANTTEDCDQKNPDIAAQADGKFALVWENLLDPDKCPNETSYESTIMARLFNADGSASTGEIQLSQTSIDNQDLGIAADNRGGYVAIWRGDAASGGDQSEIWARRLLANGSRDGAEFQINTDTSSFQVFPAIASDPNGNLFSAWGSWRGDNSGTSIRARRLKVGQ